MSPLLKIGITFAIFNASGKTPAVIELFIREARGAEMRSATDFTTETGISSAPQAEVFLDLKLD